MTANTAKKRTPIQIERDRREIASLYLQGWTQAAIGDHLDMTQQMVSYDLKVIQAEWKQSAIRDLDAAKAEELAKIDELERTYWQEWDRSREDKESTLTEKVNSESGARVKAQMRKEGRLGEPRYLEGVQWCIERRCKLLGLDAPEKKHLTGQIDVRQLSDDELIAIAEA